MVVIVESKPSLSVLIVTSLIYTGQTILILYDGFTSPTGKNTELKVHHAIESRINRPLVNGITLRGQYLF